MFCYQQADRAFYVGWRLGCSGGLGLIYHATPTLPLDEVKASPDRSQDTPVHFVPGIIQWELKGLQKAKRKMLNYQTHWAHLPRICCKRAKCASRHQAASRTFEIPIGLENPWRSWLMLHEDLKDEIAEATKRGLTDMCAFGAACRKRTDLVLWGSTGVRGDVSLFRVCSTKGGCCDFSKKKHEALEGKSGKVFKTAGAAAYPPAFCTAVVHVFVASACA